MEIMRSSRFGDNKGGRGYAFLSLVFLLEVHWTHLIFGSWGR